MEHLPGPESSLMHDEKTGEAAARQYPCPNCRAEMSLARPESSYRVRVCPVCRTLAWDEDGTTEFRVPPRTEI
jgi:hypothetical protein